MRQSIHRRRRIRDSGYHVQSQSSPRCAPDRGCAFSPSKELDWPPQLVKVLNVLRAAVRQRFGLLDPDGSAIDSLSARLGAVRRNDQSSAQRGTTWTTSRIHPATTPRWPGPLAGRTASTSTRWRGIAPCLLASSRSLALPARRDRCVDEGAARAPRHRRRGCTRGKKQDAPKPV